MRRRFGICPWRDELLEGMLGASILGFHTQPHCNNFLDSVDRFLEAANRPGAERGRPARPKHAGSSLPDLARVAHALGSKRPRRPGQCRAEVFRELGLPPDALLGHRSGPPRLHQGDRGATPLRRAPAGAISRASRPVDLRPARGPEPDGHPALPQSQRKRRTVGRRASTSASAGMATVRSFCAAPIMSRRRCSATTARPTSAMSAAFMTA